MIHAPDEARLITVGGRFWKRRVARIVNIDNYPRLDHMQLSVSDRKDLLPAQESLCVTCPEANCANVCSSWGQRLAHHLDAALWCSSTTPDTQWETKSLISILELLNLYFVTLSFQNSTHSIASMVAILSPFKMPCARWLEICKLWWGWSPVDNTDRRTIHALITGP